MSDSDVWLDVYENLRCDAMSSQDISRLLGIIDYDGMMTYYASTSDCRFPVRGME